VLCPDYGDVREPARPIRYATETVSMPPLSAPIAESFQTDDTFDDFIPVVLKPATDAAVTPSVGQAVVSEELSARLTSIDANLSRIATALELLVGHLSKAS